MKTYRISFFNDCLNVDLEPVHYIEVTVKTYDEAEFIRVMYCKQFNVFGQIEEITVDDLFEELYEEAYLANLVAELNEVEDETEESAYIAWVAEMDKKIAEAIAEEEEDLDDDFYATYKGVVNPYIDPNYDYYELVDNTKPATILVDNYKPIYPIFE